MPSYRPAAIEPKWQQYWESNSTFATPDADGGKPKSYILDMFPYPSGAGLHVGHPEGYTATDILARFQRMRGFHVLHPMGWDAFGLPAEQHAIQTGEHPRLNTANNIANFRRQIKSLGFSYDWSREVDTTDPNYFKWTQWIFLLLYDTWYDPELKKGRPIAELPIPADCHDPAAYRDRFRLAYRAEVPVNWCEALGTVLANEEVVDGLSERGQHPVVRMPLKQWLMRITAYAERLIDDLEPLDWSESIKQMQRNWIGRSAGCTVRFQISDRRFQIAEEQSEIEVFTTRPDTLFGATYMVLAPEHPLVGSITTAEQAAAVKQYQADAARKSDFDRTELAKTKTGVFTGAYAINPVNDEEIPIWIADYVLATYGTGAIMAVPGHDERDFEFAQQFGLPIKNVVSRGGITYDWELFTEPGVAINSGFLNGLSTRDAKQKITAWLAVEGKGEAKINYKLRDWLFSRQRYWGEPFPILHGEDGSMVPVPVAELPVTLPDVQDYKPTGSPEGPLAKATEWRTVVRDGRTYLRETNTMPQWAGSCWYYLRYIDPHNDRAFADPEKLKQWLPVDLYVGGAEHAVLHLLYSRFWHKVLFDRGYVHCTEPFHKLVNQGMILGENSEKMSKSRGNVINPDDVVKEYGADALRLFEMFMGPLEAVKPWSTKGVEGVYRFLGRVWRLLVDDGAEEATLDASVSDVPPPKEMLRELHRTIRKVTDDTAAMKFNTAISAMMEFTNFLTKQSSRPISVLKPFVLLLAPYAPHAAEELWSILGGTTTLAYEPWPSYDEALCKADEIEVPVKVNGKIKVKLSVPAEIEEAALEAAAMANEAVIAALAGKVPKKVIVVPKKLVNIVA